MRVDITALYCCLDDFAKPEALVAVMRDIAYRVVGISREAGSLSQWLYKGLTEAGFATVLMETRQVKGALKAMPIKTDRRDAEGIARLLQVGWFHPVHCKSISAQETRAVLTSRKAIKQALISIELSVRGVLRNFGLHGIHTPIKRTTPDLKKAINNDFRGRL